MRREPQAASQGLEPCVGVAIIGAFLCALVSVGFSSVSFYMALTTEARPGPAGPAGPKGAAGAAGAAGAQGPRGYNSSDLRGPIMVEMYITASVPTTFPDAVTWVKVGGTWANSVVAPEFDFSNGRLTYLGTTRLIAHGFASYSFMSSTNGETIQIAPAKNGTVIETAILDQKTGTGGDVVSSALHFMCTFDQYDFVETYALHTTWTVGDTVTMRYATFGMMVPREEYATVLPG